MQLKDHLQFIGQLGLLGFKSISVDPWIAKKENVSVAFWGNSLQPYFSDIIIKKGNQSNNPNRKCFKNYNLDEYEQAFEYVKELLCYN